ncbi:hypothetical protein [Ruegeria conchae]|nr:hypothetical protein [Ruegeria conchae]
MIELILVLVLCVFIGISIGKVLTWWVNKKLDQRAERRTEATKQGKPS